MARSTTLFLHMVRRRTAVIAMIALSAVWSSAELTAAPVLVGRAVLPADTFAPGPTSGTRIGLGPINDREVPFDHQQPVQGASAVLGNHEGTFLAMSDNGFGSLENSAEQDNRDVKRVARPMLGFKSFWAAQRTFSLATRNR
jgi:hypothetical protein